MQDYKNEKINNVHKAIELIQFPLCKLKWHADSRSRSSIKINDWQDVFKTFGLECMQEDILIDLDSYTSSYERSIHLLMGKSEDISLCKLKGDIYMLDFEQIVEAQFNKYMRQLLTQTCIVSACVKNHRRTFGVNSCMKFVKRVWFLSGQAANFLVKVHVVKMSILRWLCVF